MTSPTPRRLRFLDDEKTLLAIDWTDEHVSVLPTTYLRGWCPCAVCQGHGGTRSFVSGRDSNVKDLRQVGAYALGVSFADGHDTGIYTWGFLRELCPCTGCGGPVEGTPEPIAERASAAVDPAG